MAPLDPWIIEEILRREREQKEERQRQQIEISIDEPGREVPSERKDEGEMPAERKPGYEMPNPNAPTAPPAERKEDTPRRGVDISRISGGDDEPDDDGSITIDISKIPPAFPEEEKKKDEKRPD